MSNNNTMVSFDVTNLFTSIPVDESVLFVRCMLESRMTDHSKIVDIISLLRICLKQFFFQFNGKFYEQEDGLAIGSCLSPFLDEVFMEHMENNFILTDRN